MPKNIKYPEEIKWFDTGKPGLMWHAVNGWEDPATNEIVLFAPLFESYPDNLPINLEEEPDSYLTCWKLNLSTGEVKESRVLDKIVVERNDINRKYIG